MEVTINSITPKFNDTGILELDSMICYITGGVYPDNTSGYVSLGATENITLTSTKLEVEAAAIAKFKANVAVLFSEKAE